MLKISPLFSDGAVLCRRKVLRIFGQADSGTEVSCELQNEKGCLLARASTVSQNGKFLILLPPQEAATGCRLILSAGSEAFTASDIAIGELFLAGGQSNMELELQNADEGPERIAVHQNPCIRYFNVPKFAVFSDERNHAWEKQHWQKLFPGKAGDISAVAYFFALKLQQKLGIPVGIIDSYLGGTSITCWMDEAWLNRTAEGHRYLIEYAERTADISLEIFLDRDQKWQQEMEDWNRQAEIHKADHPNCTAQELSSAIGPFPWHPPEGPASPYRPAGLYNTMIEPLLPLALTGILFYQGEADAGLTNQYDVLMMSLIDRWRTAFEDETLPFLFVQLPMWIDRNAADSKTWPVLRLAQSKARDRMRNTGMICLLDQGEYDNIHPTNKRVVGERLYDLAEILIYRQPGKASPRILEKQVKGSSLILQTDQTLFLRRNDAPLLLEIAGADRHFIPAQARIEGTLLILSAPELNHPLYARYAWTDYGQVHLFNADGLPLEPFDF